MKRFVFIGTRKPIKKNEITNSFVRAAETRRFVLLIPISLHFSVLWSEMSCYRFPKYLLQPKALFFHSKLKYKCKEMHNAAIRHVFVFIAGLSSHVPWEQCKGASELQKRVHKQKQCIENGSLWRAFNELRFHCVHIHRFQQFRYTVWCKALQRVLVSTHFFSLFFLSILHPATWFRRQAYHRNHHPAYMHTLPNKLAKKCEKVLISLIVVGMKRNMHHILWQKY